MGDYYSCAQALPQLPPVVCGDGPYYRVTEFCKWRSNYGSDWRNAVPVLKTGLEKCKKCPMFTDSSKYVRIKADMFHTDLYLDRLADLPAANLRKLFKLILSHDWENERAIETLGAYLDAAAADNKKAWADASSAYQHGWRETRPPYTAPGLDVKKARAENNRLTKAVKHAKAKHERWVKIQALWNDTKHQMNY